MKKVVALKKAIAFGLQHETPRGKPTPQKFVRRVYKLVPLSDSEMDAYSPGGPCSGRVMPKYNEVLVGETFYEGIG